MKKQIIFLIIVCTTIQCSQVHGNTDTNNKLVQTILLLTKANVGSLFDKTQNACVRIDTNHFKKYHSDNIKDFPSKRLDEIVLDEGNNYKRFFDHPVFGYNEISTKLKRNIRDNSVKITIQYSNNEKISYKNQPEQHFEIKPGKSHYNVCQVKTNADYDLLLITKILPQNQINIGNKTKTSSPREWVSKITKRHNINTTKTRYLPDHSKLTAFCKRHYYPFSDVLFNNKKTKKIIKDAVMIYRPKKNKNYFIIKAPRIIHKTTNPLGWKGKWGKYQLIIHKGEIKKYNAENQDRINCLNSWSSEKSIITINKQKFDIQTF